MLERAFDVTELELVPAMRRPERLHVLPCHRRHPKGDRSRQSRRLLSLFDADRHTDRAADEELAAVAFDADGLVPAIVQEHGTGEVLMMAWMNEEALRRTLDEGRTWFWSRSRKEYWRKGDTSGDRQWVRAAYYDCDMDTLLIVVEQEGRGACHTGRHSCFFRAFGGGDAPGTL